MKLFTRIAYKCAYLLLAMVFSTSVTPASELDYELELGPLSLGMSLEHVQQIIGAEGFRGFGNLSPEKTERSFLSASGESVLTLVFDRQKDVLTYIEISSSPTDLSTTWYYANLKNCTDWSSKLTFEDWTASDLRLGADKSTVLQTQGLPTNDEFEDIDTFYVQYGPRKIGSSERHWRVDSSGESLLLSQDTSQVPQRMIVRCLDGKIQSISLMVEP